MHNLWKTHHRHLLPPVTDDTTTGSSRQVNRHLLPGNYIQVNYQENYQINLTPPT